MRARRLLVVALAVLVGLAGTVTAQRAIDRMRARTFDEELLYLPNEKLLNHCTGGLASIVADVLWLKCIQYTARHFKTDYKFTWLNQMCDTITRLDPHFTDAYRYGAIFLAALKADDDASTQLLRRGMMQNPDQWVLPYEIAMVYLLNRRNQPGSAVQAANYLAIAAATGRAPARIAELAAALQKQENLADIERKMWWAGSSSLTMRAQFKAPPCSTTLRTTA